MAQTYFNHGQNVIVLVKEILLVASAIVFVSIGQSLIFANITIHTNVLKLCRGL